MTREGVPCVGVVGVGHDGGVDVSNNDRLNRVLVGFVDAVLAVAAAGVWFAHLARGLTEYGAVLVVRGGIMPLQQEVRVKIKLSFY